MKTSEGGGTSAGAALGEQAGTESGNGQRGKAVSGYKSGGAGGQGIYLWRPGAPLSGKQGEHGGGDSGRAGRPAGQRSWRGKDAATGPAMPCAGWPTAQAASCRSTCCPTAAALRRSNQRPKQAVVWALTPPPPAPLPLPGCCWPRCWWRSWRR